MPKPIRPLWGLALSGLLLAASPLLSHPALASAVSFTVTNNGDASDGACTIASTGNGCSLREAITAANSVNGSISFAPSVTGTITLASSLPNVTGSVTITGPGANVLAIDGSNTIKILTVTGGGSSSISGLTFQNGHDSTPYSNGFNAGGGGAIYLLDATLSVSACSFVHNSSPNEGGAINAYGPLTVTNSTFSGNSAAFGGGISVTGTAYGPHNGSATLKNLTLVGNTANYGGGLTNYGTMNIDTCTLTGNTNSVVNNFEAVTINNSIVAGNSGGDLLNPSYTGANNFVGGDAKFDPAGLQDNGGTTKTIGLLPSSPCINAGNPAYAGLSSDQRGNPYDRVKQGRLDIGAYEVQGPRLTARDFAFTEGNTSHTINFNVTLSAASASNVTVYYATADNSAVDGTDYIATSGSVTFAPGETTKPIPITLLGNLKDQDDRNFVIYFSQVAPYNAELGDAAAVVTIVDDDLTPKISVAPNSVTEGDAGTTNLDFTVSLDAASAKTVTVEVFTDNGAAAPKATPGTDYTTLAPNTLTFTPGQTTKTVSVQVNGDTIPEQNENIRINLRNPVNGYVNTASKTALGTINDDDTPPIPSISINDRSITEGETSRNVTFTVTLSQATTVPVTVNFETAEATATAGSDYSEPNGTLTFAPGETTKFITATILGDTIDENDETFFVNLSSPTNATIADGQGIGTIVDNDAAPSLSIDNVSQAEGNDGTTAFTFTVTLNGTSEKTLSVDAYTAASSAPSATADVDYASVTPTTLTFAPGDTTKTFTVYVNGDAAVEANEKFAVRLQNAVNATIKTAFGIGTIQNDDAPTFRAPSGRLF